MLGRSEAFSIIHPENVASIRVAARVGEVSDREAIVNGQPRHIYAVRR